MWNSERAVWRLTKFLTTFFCFLYFLLFLFFLRNSPTSENFENTFHPIVNILSLNAEKNEIFSIVFRDPILSYLFNLFFSFFCSRFSWGNFLVGAFYKEIAIFGVAV